MYSILLVNDDIYFLNKLYLMITNYLFFKEFKYFDPKNGPILPLCSI
jgi:hypothetical protein